MEDFKALVKQWDKATLRSDLESIGDKMATILNNLVEIGTVNGGNQWTTATFEAAIAPAGTKVYVIKENA